MYLLISSVCAILIIFGVLTITAKNIEMEKCAFLDTVNITDSKIVNGSYMYEDLLIPPELVAYYDYDLVNGNTQINVANHLRGCVCKLRSCIKFCCPPNQMLDMETMTCTTFVENDYKNSLHVEVTLNNGSTQIKNVFSDFLVQQGNFCSQGFMLEFNETDTNWKLFENGTFFRTEDEVFLDRGTYCLTPAQDNRNEYVINAFNCGIELELPVGEILKRIGMLISIPLFLVTAIVYLLISELRTLHGLCLISYLITLALGYSMFVIMSFEKNNNYSMSFCISLAYVSYYCFLSAFIWLSVISFDVFKSICRVRTGNNQMTHFKQFCTRTLYGWGIPSICMILVYSAETWEIYDNFKPNFGEVYCWFNTDEWAAMLYFYGPILLIMLYNLTMFILTAIKIYGVQHELANIMADNVGSRNLNKNKENYGLFLRLFIVMGVNWLMEVFSYMVGRDNMWSYLFIITDSFNAFQGAIIFVLFVARRKIIKLIKKRLFRRNGDLYKRQHKNSTSLSSNTK